MSNIIETIDRYETTCKGEGKKVSTFIMKILNHDKEQCMLAEKKGDSKEEANLYLAGNNKLVTEDVRIDDDDCLMLYQTLRNNTYITGLDLRYNRITDKGAEYIAKLIEESPGLKILNLMYNDIEEEGAKHIAKALHQNETLTSLRMNGNKIGDQGGMFFAQMLQINTTLESLDVGETDMKTSSVIAFSTVLNHNTTLKALNVNRPILFSHQEETTVHYANMLKVNKHLQEIHLMKYDMRDFGATRLSENLMDNFTLTYLNLSCNRITRDGAFELAKLLKRDTSLKVLDLGYNRIEDDGAIHMAKSLAAFNTNLTTLVLVSNNIHGKGLCAIADCLKLNVTLTNVYIWGNKLEESACMAFAGLIDSGRLELRDTDVEPYTADGTTYLSQLSHGIRNFYYWGPAYGENPQPELVQFTQTASAR